MNEENVNGTFAKQVYDYYLNACGYTEVEEGSLHKNVKLHLLGNPPEYFIVKDISDDTADEIATRKKRDDVNVSLSDREALLKFYFQKKFLLRGPIIPHGYNSLRQSPEYCLWLSRLWPTIPSTLLVGEFLPVATKGFIDESCFGQFLPTKFPGVVESPFASIAIENMMMKDVPAWATYENLDLLWRGPPTCPNDCKEDHPHSNSDTPLGYLGIGNPSKFSNISLEKLAHRNLDSALATAAADDFRYGFGDLRYSRKGNTSKLFLILELLKVLGVPNTCSNGRWSFEDWKAVHAKLTVTQTWPDTIIKPDGSDYCRTYKTSSLLTLLTVVFMLRDRRSDEHPHRDFIHSVTTISRVLDAWSLSGLTTKMESPRKASVRAASEQAGQKLDWNEFQKDFKAEVLSSNETPQFLRTNKKNERVLSDEGNAEMKRRYQEIKDALLPNFKSNVTLEQKFSVELVPYMSAYEPILTGPVLETEPEKVKTGLLYVALPERTPNLMASEFIEEEEEES